jgi:hypothetical protein
LDTLPRQKSSQKRLRAIASIGGCCFWPRSIAFAGITGKRLPSGVKALPAPAAPLLARTSFDEW